jgi:polyisoprenyl-teichoic acid--peptidoglycan teichoic acid transferase
MQDIKRIVPEQVSENENNREENQNSGQKPKNKKGLLHKLLVFFMIFIFTGGLVFSSQILTSDQEKTSGSWFSRLPIINQIKHLAESADRELKGEKSDRINILLLGMGGKNHDGGYLTDTIILASIQPSTGKVAMISIPRDLAVPIENMGWRKINHVNAYAEMENKGTGGLAISQAVSDILDIPIDYYVRVDFQGFIDIIDELGGVDVQVENTLNDYKYPVRGRENAEDFYSRYEHLHVEKGLRHMDGDLALKFARSRHAYGVEGSDFARARRQQLIIQAVKDKALQKGNIFKPAMIGNIIGELQEHVHTNLKIWEIIKLWDMVKNLEKDNVYSHVLDNAPNGLLINNISDQGAYILVPRSGDFSEIRYFVNNIFSDAPQGTRQNIVQEKATIEVRNGTWINGLASKVSVDLEKYGFTIIRIGNSSRQNFQKSVIYDLTYGEKSKSLSQLKEYTKANVSFGLPEWLVTDISSELGGEKNPVQPDFILILGQDADKTDSGKENYEKE